MISLAGYAPSQAIGSRGPSAGIAAFLTVLTPGLGHLYIGQARRGIFLFFLVVAADTLLMFALMGVLARFWMFAVSLALLLGLWLYILVEATLRAHWMADHPRRAYNKRSVYVGAFALAWLITAVPFLYAAHAKSSGQLGYFRATSDSMAPTLLPGEYFLADATSYRSRAPSRGEVAVYVHPKHEGTHVIKRIVAVEGDRIAVRNGHAIVNGMAVEEPYVVTGSADAVEANMPEIRVPAGHVFVLGDNRANSIDSRDAVAHGPVPVANLIGRVTDIAFSPDLSRMGRWIGTPSNF
ncbi:MAG TPA: signal peptidase I [Xanthobacteraceae bacterium]|jgi:signal peptidase I